MRIESLAIVDFREGITNALIRLLGCSDRSVPSSLYLYCLHAKNQIICFSMGPVLFAMISLQCAIPIS